MSTRRILTPLRDTICFNTDGLLIHGKGLVGTTELPVSGNNIYRTPQVSGATTLRVKAGGDAGDAAAGAGARSIEFVGLNEKGELITETIATAGASASAATSQTFLRLHFANVSGSGTYASAAAGSQVADITIENGAGTEDWGLISLNGYADGQTEIGAYSVPLGHTAYLSQSDISVDSTKTADVNLYQRENILETAPPYTPVCAAQNFVGIANSLPTVYTFPLTFPELTDIFYMASVPVTSAIVAVDLHLLLVPNESYKEQRFTSKDA